MKSYINFLGRNKLYTAIEAIGLTISLAFMILLGTYIWQQYRVINENPDSDRIYLLGDKSKPGLSTNEKLIFESQPVPEIETMCRYELVYPYAATIDNNLNFVRAAMVDVEWFDIFPYYEFVVGSPRMLNDKNNVFVSLSFANTLGSPDEIIGKRISAGGGEYVIAGIIQDFQNTLFQKCDIIMNGKTFWPDNEGINYSRLGSIYNFLRLKEEADVNILEAKITDILVPIAPYVFDRERNMPKLWSIEEAFFTQRSRLAHADGNMLRILVIIVIALLVSAAFNYINLSFAVVTKRAKEMATRRLVGADRQDVIFKCILESVLFTVVCFAAALMIAIAFEPVLNSLLVGYDANSFVPIDISLSLGYIAVSLLSVIILGLIVGIVPALGASAFKPVDVVKGAFRTRSKMIFNKCFIVVQNVLAVVLISMGILMEVQLSHMVNRPMNARTDNLYYLECEFRASPEMVQALRDNLLKNPDVKRVGLCSGFPGSVSWNKSYLTLKDGNGVWIDSRVMSCDSVAFDMLNFNIVEDMHTQLNKSLWISESLKAESQWNDEVAASVFGSQWNPDTDHLGGVYKDVPAYLDRTLNTVIEVLPPDRMFASYIIETMSESKEIGASILKIYEDFSREWAGTVIAPNQNGFIKDLHMELMAQNIRFIRLVEIFMALAVLLSFLGLIAMSTYFAEQSSKDIAIRKVFGGTIESETMSNVRTYMIMVAIACIVGVPIAVYAAGRYLEQFAYRIENYWWIFVLAVVLSFAISLLSVLWQTLKAARTNPVAELKKE